MKNWMPWAEWWRPSRTVSHKEREDIKVIGGGIVPEKDISELKAMGVKRIFHPGTPLEKILEYIKSLVGSP